METRKKVSLLEDHAGCHHPERKTLETANADEHSLSVPKTSSTRNAPSCDAADRVWRSSLDSGGSEASGDTVYVETWPNWNAGKNLRFLIVLLIFVREKRSFLTQCKECWLFASVFRFFFSLTERERGRNDFCPMKFLLRNSDSSISFSSPLSSASMCVRYEEMIDCFSCQYF